jgi:Uma2 family endonuclease
MELSSGLKSKEGTMVQASPELLTFEEFLDWYPETGRYELHDGLVVLMQPRGDHEEVAGFMIAQLNLELARLQVPYFIPRSCIVRPLTARSGYQPDAIVLDRTALDEEPLWARRSTITQGRTVKLIIEVTSTNWRDDYLMKLKDYEEMGISEYWIADYLGLAASRYIGSPKVPTFSVYSLVDGEYQVRQFRGPEPIASPTFSGLNLTAAQIFSAGKEVPNTF